jgi:glycosyltransferase involved in cell wall biosynthesis
VVGHLAARDERFSLVRQPPGGIVEALTRGLARCRGRYVARMDADDWMHRDRLALQMRALDSDRTLGAVGCHVRMFPRRGMSDGLLAYERWLNSLTRPEDVANDAFVECPVVHPTLCLRREVIAAHGYRDAGWPEDYDLVLRMLAAGVRIGVLPRRLLGWRDGPERLTRTGASYRRDRILACKASFLAEGLLRGASEYVLWGYGDTGRALSRALAEHGKRPSRIVELHPGRLGQRIAGALVIHPDELGTVRDQPLVVSVSGAVARGQIREVLARESRVEGRDCIVAA